MGCGSFRLLLIFNLHDEVIAVPPSQTSKELNTKKRTKGTEVKQQENVSKKTRGECNISAELAAVKEKDMGGVEGVPKPVSFLYQNGNWPSCRTAKCKTNSTLPVYSEPEGKKPIQCTRCKSSMEVKSHFVNLKAYHRKEQLENYKVDQKNSEM